MIQPQPNRILELASAYWDSCVLLSAVDLGLFGTIAKCELADASAIAGAAGLDARATRLLLDACVANGLLEKSGEQYRNTPESAAFLVPGGRGDLTKALMYNRDVYPAWGRLAELMRTGKPVERPEVHLGDDPKRTRSFVMSMHGRAMAIGRAVVPMLNLAGAKNLLDVGGGPGTYSTFVAQANPGLHCTVIDLPGVVAVARELVAATDVAGRISFQPGDYHETEFPAGQDAVIFFGVLHQESPESILNLFRRAHAALRLGGQVFVMDMMTDATRTSPKFSAMFAVNMALTTYNGWVFSDADLGGWLTEAGFAQPRVSPLPPPMPHWLASAKKA